MAKRFFLCNEDGSYKFWNIEVIADDKNNVFKYRVEYGRVGTAGNSSEKAFATKAICEKEAEKIISSKLKKGYEETKEVEKLKEIFEEFRQRTALPTLVLKAKRKKDLGVTESKLGGIPYMPKGFSYPRDSEGNPLKLLAQINFSQFPKLPNYPTEGILQFYIGLDDLMGLDFDDFTNQNSFRVVYHKDITVAHENVAPNIDDEDEFFPFRGEFSLTATEDTCPMTVSDYRFNKVFFEVYKKHLETDDSVNDIFDLGDEASELIYNKFSEQGHRMGGYPFFTQEDPREDGDAHNLLLLQIDSDGDGDNEIMWGDMGVANFFISLEKLKALDFSDVLYTWDCG